MNAAVMTVTGPVDPDALGHTVTDVRLLGSGTGSADLPDVPVRLESIGALIRGAASRDDLLLDERTALAGLREYAAAGGGTVVDVSSRGLGVDPAALARVSQATGVHVVMGGGRYRSTPTELIVGDLTNGADGVRPGVIGDVGVLDPAHDRAVALAVATASLRTGVPVLLRRGADTPRLLDLFADAGVDPSRIAVGHCSGAARDMPLLAELAGRGVFLQFDGLGRFPTVHTEVDDQDVAAAILALAERGHAGQLLLSPGVSRKIDLTEFGGSGYGFVAGQFLPYLGFLGADETLARTVTVDNPRRFLTITPPGSAG